MDELVMIPALGSDAAVWRRTIAALGSEFRCMVGDTLNDGSLPAMAHRILDGAPPTFALAGISMGGFIALEIMRMAPERVTCLALFDTTARPDTPEEAERKRRISDSLLTIDDLHPFAHSYLDRVIHPSAPAEVRTELVDMIVRLGARTYVRQNNAVISRLDFRPMLGSISIPTQVIVGDQDLLTPPELAQEIHDAVEGSTMHIVQSCGHLPPIEQPEISAELLRTLLRTRN
jgi:pimeloyl-ACP methyl ester carboxylesterase